MKVLIVQNIEGVAGSEKYFLALVPELIKNGLDCAIYCVYKPKYKEQAQKFFDLLDEKNIPYYLHASKSYGSLNIPRKISVLCKREDFDIVHCHLIYADFWGAILKSIFNKKLTVISTKHGYHEDSYVEYCNQPENLTRNLYYRLFRFTHKKLDRSYACSYGLVDFYERSNLISKGSMDVVQHGFNYPEIDMSTVNRYSFAPIQLIIVGRLIRRKGHTLVLSILPQLIKQYPELKLIILGDGELEEQLKEEARRLNLENHVLFLGFKSEVEQYLVASDIALVPSYSEGLPLVIFEAFNAKVPVVTFDSIGCNELVEHEKTGLIAEAFSQEDFMKQIIRLIEDPNLRAELAGNAYIELKEHFSLERMARDTIEFYRKVQTDN